MKIQILKLLNLKLFPSIKVDDNSINPGQHVYEKMISGMYMGELIRQVLVDLMKDDLIFFNCNRQKLFERGNWVVIDNV